MMHDDPAIKKEAIWAISNATAGVNTNPSLMADLVKHNIIQAIGVALKFEEPRIIFVALEGLSNVLAYGQKIATGGENPYSLLVE